MIRVLLADDQALVRAGFRALLDSAPDISVVAEAATGAEAVRLAVAERPDIALLDIRMPELDGLAAAERILADPRLSSTRVVILTTFDLDEYIFEALRLGASGFLVKDTEPEDLINGVRVVARGEALLSPSVTRRVIAEYAGRPPRPGPAAARPDRPGTRSGGPGGGRAVQRGDRCPPGAEPSHGENPCQPGHGQTAGPRPGPTGGGRLRDRPGGSGVDAVTGG